jgi:sulfotransferase family protein
VPPERRTGPPDFVGIGTHLSGTDWWFEQLTRHPAIAGHTGDEAALHFFEPFAGRPMTDADVADYHARFPRREGTIAGEWSTRYVFDPWTLPLLRRAAPDAKLLVLMRDPIVRYRMSLGFRRQERASDDAPIYMAEAVHRGRYGSQLRALLSFFEADQVLVLQTERCLADPAGEYARTLRFLGVDPGYLPPQLRRRARHGTSARAPMRALRAAGLPETLNRETIKRLLGQTINDPADLWPELDHALRAELEPEVRALVALVDDLDLELWPSFAADGPARRPDAAPTPARTTPVIARPSRALQGAIAAGLCALTGGATALVLALADVI